MQFVDYDLDGWLDIFHVQRICSDEYNTICSSARLHVYHNDRSVSASFTEVVVDSSSNLHSISSKICIADMDNDGLPDVVDDAGVWLNDGITAIDSHGSPVPTFTQVSKQYLVPPTADTGGCELADVDGDGRTDALYMNAEQLYLFRNEGRGMLRDQPQTRFDSSSHGSYNGAAFGDVSVPRTHILPIQCTPSLPAVPIPKDSNYRSSRVCTAHSHTQTRRRLTTMAILIL